MRREASGAAESDPSCALCGGESDVQAAHIVPQSSSEADLVATELYDFYDIRNGFLLCDQCHDFFDAGLWSVDAERKVVLSEALIADVRRLAGFRQQTALC